MARRRHNHNRLSEPGMIGGGLSAIRTSKEMGKPGGEDTKPVDPAERQPGLPGSRAIGDVPPRGGKPSAPPDRDVPPIVSGQERDVISAIGQATGRDQKPPPRVEATPFVTPVEELRSMTIKALRALAAEHRIDLGSARLKDDIIAALLDGGRK